MSSIDIDYLVSGDHWSLSNPDAFPHRIAEHLGYTGLSMAIAVAIAVPIGLWIGHTGRGAFAVISLGNAGRALPTLGVVMLALAIVGLGLLPITIALVVLAIPPIMTASYAAVQSVSGDAVDAARGVGMTERQVLMRVELPIGLPIVMGGVRNATLQVVSTATIAAYTGLGGLGRYLFDGLALRDYSRVVAGAVVLALLAVVIDLALGGLQRILVSPGVDGRVVRRGRPGSPAAVAPAALGFGALAPASED